MKNKYVDLEVLNHGLKELATKINSVFRKIKDSYTKTEIDDKFTSIAKGMNWKPSVATKVDLEALTDNSKSDTRIVEDESKIYIYNGTSWEGIGSSANVPKATIDNDGLMSKEDFTKLEGIEPDKYETKEDFNTKVGSLTSLNTDNKDSVVSAINEVKEDVNNTVKIDDTKLADNSTYSSNKINNTYVAKEEGKSLVENTEISKIHEHNNKDDLDKLGHNDNGNLTYNGKEVSNLSNYYNKTESEEKFAEKNHNHDTIYRKIDDSYSKTEIDNKGFLTEHQDISGKQDKLKIGTNITISDDNTISATEIDDTKSSTISVYSSDKSDKTYESIANYNTDKGTTDISTIGDGTFTGAIDTLNTLVNNVATDEDIASLFS